MHRRTASGLSAKDVTDLTRRRRAHIVAVPKSLRTLLRRGSRRLTEQRQKHLQAMLLPLHRCNFRRIHISSYMPQCRCVPRSGTTEPPLPPRLQSPNLVNSRLRRWQLQPQHHRLRPPTPRKTLGRKYFRLCVPIANSKPLQQHLRNLRLQPPRKVDSWKCASSTTQCTRTCLKSCVLSTGAWM